MVFDGRREQNGIGSSIDERVKYYLDVSVLLLGMRYSAAVGCCAAEGGRPAKRRQQLRRSWVLSPSMLAVGGESAGLLLKRLTLLRWTFKIDAESRRTLKPPALAWLM